MLEFYKQAFLQVKFIDRDGSGEIDFYEFAYMLWLVNSGGLTLPVEKVREKSKREKILANIWLFLGIF